ncbi:MAG TPA: MBL fold metallo-hydrolase [Acidimicrobiales bacterium]|nr:MBL fold metallo-hydrolase [Acidimicrobiales bacterium]
MAEALTWDPLDGAGGRVAGVALPVTYAVGTVNCWIFPDRPVTLVDPGMLHAGGFERLQAALAERGLALADVDQVVVTHGHPDHWGAVGAVVEASDAVVLGTAEELRKITAMSRWDFPPDEIDLLVRMIARLGFPPEVAALAPDLMRATITAATAPLDPASTRAVHEGDTVALGAYATVAGIHAGHVTAHLCLDADVFYVSGDHLLADITPNPFFELDATRPELRRASLPEYLDSLPLLADQIGAAPVLPGHGPTFDDAAAVVAVLRRKADARTEEMLALLAGAGPEGWTPVELAERAFPDEAGGDVFLAVAECAGHLDRLVADGRAHVDPTGRYAVTSGSSPAPA